MVGQYPAHRGDVVDVLVAQPEARQAPADRHLAQLAGELDAAWRLLAARLAQAGLTPVTDTDNPALTRGRLSRVDQNYLRADTHSAANARLVDAQAGIGIARLWGGGLVASADGLRFAVPVQTINALPSPRYFGRGRGVTWMNAINDQVAGIGAVVVPGTVRDSLHILDTLLNLDAGPKPEMVATDTASYSDIVFGLFRLLGYRFSPRIADLADQQFWRATLPGAPEGDCGSLNALARHRVSWPRSAPTGTTCCAWPGPWSPARSAPMTCCACSAATATRPR